MTGTPHFYLETGSVLIDVPAAELVPLGLKQRFLDDGFVAKSDLHLTVVGWQGGSQLLGAMPNRKAGWDWVQETIRAVDWQIEPTEVFYHVSKWIEKYHEQRESLIMMVNCSQVTDVIALLNERFTIQLPPQPPHLTLMTKGSDKGISINSADDLSEFGTKVNS